MATMFAAEMTERVCSEAMQVFGGYRYPTGNPVERYYRDARIRHIYAGAGDIQRMVISRMLAAE